VRIGYLVSQYPAPSHTFIRREIAALRARGLVIDAFSTARGESLSELDRLEEERTFTTRASTPYEFARSLALTAARHPFRWLRALVATLRHRLPGASSLLKAALHFVEGMRLAVELERREVTHLHVHFANAASHAGLAAARYLGIGWSLSLHGLSDFGGPGIVLLREKVSACRFVASASDWGRAQVMRVSDPADWRKVHVVRCGIDVAALPSRVRRPLERGTPLRMISVGRLAPEKAHRGLVEAFDLALARGIDARLSIIGSGPEEGRLRAAVAERGLRDRVELLGKQPEAAVLEAMAEAHLFVLSSLAEGLPVVLMEALALELAVIAPAINGIPELVSHGETGLLFCVGRWDELAERIVALARDSALRERLGAAGRRRVLEGFDVARAVEPLARLFADAHRSPVAPGARAPRAS
jgi:colanic acid/amylovoran biosynthesis glycosyltransferase